MLRAVCAVALFLALALAEGRSSGVEAPGRGGPQGTAKKPRFEHLHDIPYTDEGMPMTMIHDTGNRPYLFVAAKEGGVVVYDMRKEPREVVTIPIPRLGSQHVMSLSQAGRKVYLALGNHWGKPDVAGLAVIDVADPEKPQVAGLWKDEKPGGAGGIVLINGDTAYMAAMGGGLVILDVKDSAKIHVLSRFMPDPAFPDAKPDRSKINARGMAHRDGLLYLCNDAGGVRVIDVSDARKPAEIGRYSNPAMNGRPRAYNNIVVSGDLAYVAADYVGLEILDIANPRKIRLVAWWNPWNPKLEGLRWFSSPGHANEIALVDGGRTVLMSAGRSDLVAIDVSDRAHPKALEGIGQVEDSRATWGLSVHGDLVYLAYIRTLGIPFRADWPGVRVFRNTRN